MRLNTLPRDVLRVEYQAVRLPLQVVEQQILTRYLPDDAPLRLAFERAVGSLDEYAGRVLDDEAIQRRGEALRRRSDTLARASELEHRAQRRRIEAADEVAATTAQAADKRAEASRAQQAGVAKARQEEQAGKRSVAAQAQARAAAGAQQADNQAERRLESGDAALAATEQRIDRQERQAAAQPKAKLKAAVDEQSKADRHRDTADRLDEQVRKEREQRRNT